MSARGARTVLKPDPATIACLRDLLQANITGAEGFDAVAHVIKDRFVEIRFSECADERRTNADELSRLQQLNQTNAEHDETWLAVFHRNWLAVKGTLTSGNLVPILCEIERCEQHFADRYEHALARCPVSTISDVLRRQLSGVNRLIELLRMEHSKLDSCVLGHQADANPTRLRLTKRSYRS